VFTAMGLRVGENILYYMVVTFSITYLKTQLKMDTSVILVLLLGAHLLQFVVVPIVGRLTDRVGRRPLYALGAVLMIVWAFASFPLFDTKNNG
ncbi:MFS transporter, partial [Escherichia coli]|nr:MFS transporter [Escherichia coli]